MDFKTKKFYVFIAIEAIMLGGMIFGQIEFMTGLEWIVGTALGWGVLDTGAKFAKKGDK